MVPRIKQAISEYWGEQQWFLMVLRHGTWQHRDRLPGVTFHNRSYPEDRIELGDLWIEIIDLCNGRFRVAVGVPTTGGIHKIPRWRDTEFAHTSETDKSWVYHVHRILSEAERDLSLWREVHETALSNS